MQSTGATASAVDANVADALAQLSGGVPSAPYVVTSPTVALYLAALRSSRSRVFPDVGVTGGTLLGMLLVSDVPLEHRRAD